MRRDQLAIGVLMAASVAVLAWSWSQRGSARVAADRAVAALATAQRQAAEIQRLRSDAEGSVAGERPDEALYAAMRRTLASAAIPSERLVRVQQRSDRTVRTAGGDTSQRERLMLAELEGLTPVELGAVLAAWRSSEPAWRIAQIELARDRGRADTDPAYTVRLSLAARYSTGASTP